MFFQGTSSAQTWVRPPEARAASPHPGWSQLPQMFPQLPHPSRHPDMDEFTVPGLGPHKDPHQPLLGLQAAGRIQVSWNMLSFGPSWPPQVHPRLSCFAQAFPSPGACAIPPPVTHLSFQASGSHTWLHSKSPGAPLKKSQCPGGTQDQFHQNVWG